MAIPLPTQTSYKVTATDAAGSAYRSDGGSTVSKTDSAKAVPLINKDVFAIDYNGEPVYTVQANGVNTSATKFADGGTPSSNTFSMVFDSGAIA